jgi:Zn-dependent peptidase ImmA (M78 family)/DNA-binding XRE family transcriptional regulator
MNKQLIAKRIKEERQRCDLTQTQVAAHMGWDSSGHAIVVQVESGERDLKAWELYKLAQLFHIEVNDFFKESTTVDTLVLWRNKPQNSISLKERQFLQRCEDYKFLEDLLEEQLPVKRSLPKCKLDIATANEDWANEIADTVSGQLNLGEFPTATLSKILEESYGIRFLSLPLDEGSAACSVYSFGPAILINENEPWRQPFRIAHELFHIITWDEELMRKVISDPDIEKKNESLAEAFAAGLLIPDASLRRQMRHLVAHGMLKISAIVALANEYKVSINALLYRLKYLGFISEELVGILLSDERFRALERQIVLKPPENVEKIGERFIKLAYLAYQQFNKISRSRLAKLLNVSLASLGTALASHGFMETDDEEIRINHT